MELYSHPKYPAHWIAVDAERMPWLIAATATGTPRRQVAGLRYLLLTAARLAPESERIVLATMPPLAE